MSWQSVTLTVRGNDVEALSNALLDAGGLAVDVSDANAGTAAEQPAFAEPGSPTTVWEHSTLSVLFDEETDIEAALSKAYAAAGVERPPTYARAALAEQDWVRLTQSQFKPICISPRLWIVPSWETAPDAAAINITLDPGAAFGTGSHPTTRLCLQWLDAHIRGGESVLDYGCGSGILAIAAARLGAAHVRGVDVDPQAILAACANAMQNRVAVEFQEPGARLLPACDVVLANILAGPLISLAPLLAAATRERGHVVLSGVLEAQGDEVMGAYAPWFTMAAPVSAEGWVLLVGRKDMP